MFNWLMVKSGKGDVDLMDLCTEWVEGVTVAGQRSLAEGFHVR